MSKCAVCNEPVNSWDSDVTVEDWCVWHKRHDQEEREKASNVISLFPNKADYILLYEIVGEDGHAIYGSENPHNAITWYRKSPINTRLFVSAWDSDEEDAHLVGRAIDITGIINQAIVEGKGE